MELHKTLSIPSECLYVDKACLEHLHMYSYEMELLHAFYLS